MRGRAGRLLSAAAWVLMIHGGPAAGFQVPTSVRVSQELLVALPACKGATGYLRVARGRHTRTCVRMEASGPVADASTADAGTSRGAAPAGTPVGVLPNIGAWRAVPPDGSVPEMCREDEALPAPWRAAGEAAVRAFRAAEARTGRPLLSVYVGGSVARGEALPGRSALRAWAYYGPGAGADDAALLEAVAHEERGARAAVEDTARTVGRHRPLPRNSARLRRAARPAGAPRLSRRRARARAPRQVELAAFAVSDPGVLALFEPLASGGGAAPASLSAEVRAARAPTRPAEPLRAPVGADEASGGDVVFNRGIVQ